MTGLLAATTTAAPLAGAALGGLYLAFDLAVLPALTAPRALSVPPGAAGPTTDRDRAAADTMRAINVAIVRPSFLALLVGAPALAVAAAVVHPSPSTVGAALLQVAGLVVTVAVNVPLNDRLARDHAPRAWARFVGPWRRAHRARTAAALVAAVLGGVAVAATG